ncbi:MAG: YggT family protein [Raoultibacter sp.]
MLSLAAILMALSNTYCMVIFVYIMMSWFPMGKGVIADIYAFLGKICDPYLNIFKKFIPPIGGMLDVTPIIALLVLQFGVGFIVRFL